MQKNEIKIFYKDLGANIKKAREGHKEPITQEKLAKNVSLSRTSIVNIEQGRHHIQVHTLIDISRSLDVTISEILPTSLQKEIHDTPIITKSIDKKETRSVERELSLIENKDVKLKKVK